jgi:hypothetical protein
MRRKGKKDMRVELFPSDLLALMDESGTYVSSSSKTIDLFEYISDCT